jgi:hypothetical protein
MGAFIVRGSRRRRRAYNGEMPPLQGDEGAGKRSEIMIEVKRLPGEDPLSFEVVVREDGEETRHRVTLAAAYFARLGSGRSPERCIEAAFRFLLDREPSQAILRRFDVSVIAEYFPEFERELPHYLTDIDAGRAP